MYGNNEVVEIKQGSAFPKLLTGQILFDVKSAGVNPIDWKSFLTE